MKQRCIYVYSKLKRGRVTIARRCKSTVYICLISPALGCLLWQLAKKECPQFPAATAQQIRFRTIGLMLFDRGHAKDVPLLGKHYSASYCFQLFTPKEHQCYRKISFLEKSNTLMEKFQNFTTKVFMQTLIHIFTVLNLLLGRTPKDRTILAFLICVRPEQDPKSQRNPMIGTVGSSYMVN